MKVSFKQGAVFLFLIVVVALYPHASFSDTIYVIEHRNGAVTFTSHKPKEGVRYYIFKPGKFRLSSYGRYSRGIERIYSSRAKKFDAYIERWSTYYNVDPNLIRAIIHVESGFNPNAVSRKGARGLMQLMPKTAEELGVKDAHHPADNIKGGVKYFSDLMRRFKGDVRLALAAYNAGPESVYQYGGLPPFRETIEYVRKVLLLHKKYRKRAHE